MMSSPSSRSSSEFKKQAATAVLFAVGIFLLIKNGCRDDSPKGLERFQCAGVVFGEEVVKLCAPHSKVLIIAMDKRILAGEGYKIQLQALLDTLKKGQITPSRIIHAPMPDAPSSGMGDSGAKPFGVDRDFFETEVVKETGIAAVVSMAGMPLYSKGKFPGEGLPKIYVFSQFPPESDHLLRHNTVQLLVEPNPAQGKVSTEHPPKTDQEWFNHFYIIRRFDPSKPLPVVDPEQENQEPPTPIMPPEIPAATPGDEMSP